MKSRTVPEASDETVRRRMESVRRRDTPTEVALRRALHARGFRFRIDRRPLSSLNRRADILLPRHKVAIFVDGDFWHRCPIHASAPKQNDVFWTIKLDANEARDRDTDARLVAAGWTVARAWECAVKRDPEEVAMEIQRAIEEPSFRSRLTPPLRLVRPILSGG